MVRLPFFKKKPSNKTIRLQLLLITLLALIIRFYNLSSNPPSLNLDEVAIGYNAYSILKTGQDEYGTSFPLAFRSHDDYKAPLYIYLTSASEAVFGLNAFAVRFPSAFFGTLTIPLVYFLTKELFKKNRDLLPHLPLLTSLLLAISPWHIQFSRAAFETNVAIFFVILGTWAYLKSQKNPKFMFLTAVAFAISLYTYHTTKLFIPLFSLVLAFNSRKHLLTNKKTSLLVITTFILLVLPLAPIALSPEGQLRFKGTSVFETPTLVDSNHEQKISEWRNGRPLEAFLFHDERFAAVLTFLKGYFSHFTYDFLFNGENGPPRNLTPNVGLLYLWEAPFLLAGIYYLLKSKHQPKPIIFSWILLTPLASAFTWDAPSSTRTTVIMPIFQILTSLGIIYLINLASKKSRQKYIFTVKLVAIYFLLHYLHNYHRIAPIINADAWQFGYQQAVDYTQRNLDQYDKIVVSTNLKQPHNFFAFHSQYDPRTYLQVDGGTKSGGFNEEGNSFGKYEFHQISWDERNLEDRVLYIDTAEKVNIGRFKPIKIINHPNGKPNLVIVKKIVNPSEVKK